MPSPIRRSASALVARRSRTGATPRSRLGALVLLAALGAPLAAQESPALFVEGVERYRAGEYGEAQRLLREYVEAFGERRGPQAEHLGEAYHYLGLMTADARLAEGYFLAVAQRYPATPLADESVARLAQLHAVRGDHADARERWRALARDYPLSRYVPEVDLRVGESWLAEGDLEEAFAAFRDGFARMKDYQRRGGQGASLREIEGEYVYWLGRTLLARGAYGDARKYLNLLLLDYPGHPLEPLALYHLSESFRQDDERREAEQTWRRFGESVRNTSLESVSENPNLVAVARARETGELYRPAEAGEENGAAERASAGDFAPAPDEGLRAPEPGRPGGIVEDRPVGRTVEADVDGRVESRRDRLEEEVPETAEAARDPQPEEPAEDLPRAGEGPAAAGAPPAAVETPPDALGRRAEIIEEGRAAAGETVSGVEALEEPGAEAEEPPALEPIPPGTVFLQVGAFTSADAASRLSSSLRKRGFEPALHSGLVNGQGYYRVRFGPYQVPGDRPRLESIRNALAAGGFEAVVMRPDPGE